MSLKFFQVPMILLLALFLSLALGATLPESFYLNLARLGVLAVAGMMGLGFFILPTALWLDRRPSLKKNTRLWLGGATVLWLLWVVFVLRLVNGEMLVNNATILVTGLLGGVMLGWLHRAEQRLFDKTGL